MIMLKALHSGGRKDLKIDGTVATVMATYAEMLASEGSFDAALTFLGDFQGPKISELRDRLYRALGYGEQQVQGTQRSSYQNQPQRQSVQSNYNTPQPRQWQTSPFTPTTPINQFPTNPAYQYPGNYHQEPNSFMPMQPVAQPGPPPPPPTATSIMPSRPPSAGPSLKPKYPIDPSVKSGPTYPASAYAQPPAQVYPSFGQQNTYAPPSKAYPSNESEPMYQGHQQMYNPPIMQQPLQQQPPQHVQQPEQVFKAEPQPFGWNDPPNIQSSRAVQQVGVWEFEGSGLPRGI